VNDFRVYTCGGVLMRFLLFLIYIANNVSAEAKFVRQNEVIQYDDANYVTFEDIGRREVGNSIYFGTAVKFHVTIDGGSSELGPYITTKLDGLVRLSSHVYEMRYKDKSHLWVWSRMGKNFDGVVLIDLETGDFEKEFVGGGFAISESGQDIAYQFKGAVFLNDTMVFPQLMDSIRFDAASSPYSVWGKTLADVFPDLNSDGKPKLISPPTWDSKDGLSIIAKTETATSSGEQSEYSVWRIKPCQGLGTDVAITSSSLSQTRAVQLAEEYRKSTIEAQR